DKVIRPRVQDENVRFIVTQSRHQLPNLERRGSPKIAGTHKTNPAKIEERTSLSCRVPRGQNWSAWTEFGSQKHQKIVLGQKLHPSGLFRVKERPVVISLDGDHWKR